MIEVGEKLELDNDKEYIVADKISLHNTSYLYLVSANKPVEVLIVREKKDDTTGEISLNEVSNNDELDYVLSQFVLNKE